MKKDIKADKQRPYKLSHQKICLTGVNFEKRSVIGYVDLTIHPLRPDLKRVKVNFKQGCIYRICINDQWEAAFLYNDPTQEICQGDAKQRNLDFFQNCHLSAMNAVDADNVNGEVTIKMPPETIPLIAELRPFRICIEYSLENPKGGIHFVVPDINDDMADRGAHMFSYGHENSSRLWFPCIDTFCEPCTWKIEITCHRDMTAVSCGDLIEVVYSPCLMKKTFHYYISTPVSAPNIAIAVGPFEILVDPNMHEVTHFCLPHLSGILKHTTGYIHEAFEFYEELLSSRYPYSYYKQVFVDESYADVSVYATMTIFSTNLLHSSRIIDQTFHTRNFMAQAVAQQFFGTFISMDGWSDAWLPKGIAGYLSTLFIKRTFGNNEFRYEINKILKEVADYENKVGGIVLDPTKKESNVHYSTKNPHTISPMYAEMFYKKATLVIRILEHRIGTELILQALNKLLSLAYTASQQKFLNNNWTNMLLSTNSFLKIISTVTGKDILPFLEQWVYQSGCARFYGNFVFNRKRNVVELEIKQDNSSKGALKYVGPLTVTIQELDGSFNHTFKIEENKTKFEITCHSKSRRNKKKKIPLMTGEEVDMDLSAMDADSPVLWLRLDPELNTLRQCAWEQPDYMWQYQLRYERDVVAQKEAIEALYKFGTPATRLALTDTIENDSCYYKVRCDACLCLSSVANSMVSSWAGPPAMMTIFRKTFGSHSCPSIIRQNNFNNFQHYFLLKTMPKAMAQLRNIHSICPMEVMRFLIDLFKYNDNSKNKYSDNYYRAALIEALCETVTPAVTTVSLSGPGLSTDYLSTDMRLILEECTRCLNLEKLLPCYRHTVTVSCLKLIRTMQKFGHLPNDPDLFQAYANYGVFMDVRLAALTALVDYVKSEHSKSILEWLLDLVETDKDTVIRHKVLMLLVDNPPFKKGDSNSLNTMELVDRLWILMNSTLCCDSRLRCGVADFYYILYGRTRPSCVPIPENMMVLNLKQKTTFLNPAIVPEKLQDDIFEEELSTEENIYRQSRREPGEIIVTPKRKIENPANPKSQYESAFLSFVKSSTGLETTKPESGATPAKQIKIDSEGKVTAFDLMGKAPVDLINPKRRRKKINTSTNININTTNQETKRKCQKKKVK
ncbi:hypothetical protein LOTGIDRAFT_228096 [Lottia gigantea]|uniref:Transcription initiation factor TFIID subunit 2 n=1 Tax=Lottia gigantea TaxID=225164 RepID=V4BCU4_LOTGI|nr:hypothetical protein LOTGIDRAFT_228096 [Lottia gigantea]ESP05566.1 hypothetical protein LOTGIDRAFT_228096 [Lottia gigantea]